MTTNRQGKGGSWRILERGAQGGEDREEAAAVENEMSQGVAKSFSPLASSMLEPCPCGDDGFKRRASSSGGELPCCSDEVRKKTKV